MLVTCRMQYAMSVSTVLQCGDAVSPGENYVDLKYDDAFVLCLIGCF